MEGKQVIWADAKNYQQAKENYVPLSDRFDWDGEIEVIPYKEPWEDDENLQ